MHEGAHGGVGDFQRQPDGLDLQDCLAEEARHSRTQRAVLIRTGLVAPQEAVGLGAGVGVVSPGQSVLPEVGLSRNTVHADLVRLEDGPQPVVVGLQYGVVLVIMAARALDRQTQKGGSGVFHRLLQPDVAVEPVPTTGQVAGGADDVRVAGSQLVTREHLQHHAIVTLVLIDRFDDPIPPAPQVAVAVADLVGFCPAVPVAVAPDVHPVAPPAFAVTGTAQQPVHHSFVGLVGIVGQEGSRLFGGRRQAGQVQKDTPQQHPLAGGAHRLEASLPVLGGHKGVDRVPNPARSVNPRWRWPGGGLKSPVGGGDGAGGGLQGSFERRPGVDPVGQGVDGLLLQPG